MRFSDLLDAARSNPLDVTIPAEWAQGRATFGGLVAALQYEALRAQVPADRPLRSLASHLCRPGSAGCTCQLSSRSAARRQGGQPVARARGAER